MEYKKSGGVEFFDLALSIRYSNIVFEYLEKEILCKQNKILCKIDNLSLSKKLRV